MSRILLLTNLTDYLAVHVDINPKYPVRPRDLTDAIVWAAWGGYSSQHRYPEPLPLLPAVLKGVVVEEEEAGAGGAGIPVVTAVLWVPECRPSALGVLVTGCFPPCFPRDFLRSWLRAVKTVALEESPGSHPCDNFLTSGFSSASSSSALKPTRVQLLAPGGSAGPSAGCHVAPLPFGSSSAWISVCPFAATVLLLSSLLFAPKP